tara:strand:+ start:1571 stop:3403 length:1833 start_codon:yes stop_codon:yes gene_type:complete
MAERNLTIYQRLQQVFGAGAMRRDVPNFNVDPNKIILKTPSKGEYDQERLQSQQTAFLRNQWNKVDSELYNQAIYYETTRLASFYDFESMEFTPEIAAALDIYAEESCTPDESGTLLTVESDSSRIRDILDNLFHKILDLHAVLPAWTRNTCKYGDNFVYLKIDPKQGIIGASQLPNIEIERKDESSYLTSRKAGSYGVEGEEERDKNIKFEWRNKSISFNAWEVAHFRLLGDDRRLPYGTSMLEKVRRIWKQLLLSEDAMMIYRVTRAPERRVFKINVGNIDDQDVQAYVQKIANNFKRTHAVDNTTGQVDLRYNALAVDQDFFVPVRNDGAANPIETLPGAGNLDQIADIEYIQKKMLAALRIPKPFLGFDEPAGEGKNLALQDIRFARTINRVQQSMVQELNKIAIVHLYILGFEDELENFTLRLQNPSTQAEMLKVEQFQSKVALYRDSVSDAGNGFGATSMTWAKKNILGFSDDDILLDLERQRMEKAAAAEMENTSEVIKNTGIFSKVDKLYGAEVEEEVVDGEGGESDMDMDMDMGTTTDSDSGGEEEPSDELMEDRTKGSTSYQDLMNTVGLDTTKKPTSKKSNLIQEHLEILKGSLDKLLE